MKNAICLSGLPRFYKKGYEYIYNNIVKPNNCDVFIHCWNEDQETEKEIVEMYKPKVYIFEKQKEDLAPRKYDYYNPMPAAPVHTQFSMFYSMKKSIELKKLYEHKNGFVYDTVSRTRFDCAIMNELLFEEYQNDFIYFPDVLRFPGVLCDYFNFGKSKQIDNMANIYDNLHSYHDQGVKLCGENMTIHHLNVQNIIMKGLNVSTILIRDEELNNRSFGKIFE